MKLEVDASEVGSKIVHARLEIPVAPGPLTLMYPKWIPGEHGPTGPINGLSGLHVRAGDRELPWRRDPLEMYAFAVTVPAGTSRLEVALDFLEPTEPARFTAGPTSTQAVAILNWNTVLLYPRSVPARDLEIEATLRLPNGWRQASALPGTVAEDGRVRFPPVSLATLVDSPVLFGERLVSVPLAAGDVPHSIEIGADRAADLVLPEGFAASYARLVEEANALAGARHYRGYHWLLTLSDGVAHFGLEHHESSDNRMEARTLLEEPLRRQLAGLLAHEYAHSWNGKFRRPRGLATASFEQAQDTSLLWVYEGLTQYLAVILPARAGLWSEEYFRERLALLAADLDEQAGRTWRPLADTARSSQLLNLAPGAGWARRRGADYYNESVLVWLEIDALLRAKSGGQASMDDFLRRFLGGASGPAEVKPYDLDEVVAILTALAPFDWQAHLRARLEQTSARAPLAGLEAAGWRLVFDERPNAGIADREKRAKQHDWSFSLGMVVGEDGVVKDVRPGRPAAAAGIAPGMKLVGVDGWRWTAERVGEALRAARDSRQPLELLLEGDQRYLTVRVAAFDGERSPHLERIAGVADQLHHLIAPRARQPGG